MNQLESILQKYNRPIHVLSVTEAPQCWRVLVEPLPRTLASGKPGQMTRITHLTSLAPDIAAQLHVPSVLVSQNGGIWIEVPKPRTDIVKASDFPTCHNGRIILGQGVDGFGVELDLTDPRHAHILVAGSTGSGKSVLLDAIIYGLTKEPNEIRLVLVDPHGTMTKWSQALGVSEIATTPTQTLSALDQFIAHTNSRLNSGNWSTRFVLVVDEFANLLDTEYGKEIEAKLIWLLANARKVGVNIILATQHPGHETCKGMMKVNFPVRVGLMVDSKTTSRIVLDRSGCESLRGKGDALLKVGGDVRRFQGAWVGPVDVMGVMQKPRQEKRVSSVKKVEKRVPKRKWWEVWKR